MNPKRFFLVSLMLLIARITAFSIVSASGPPVHMVTGGGQVTSLISGAVENFAFVVQVDGDGKVTGQGEAHAHGSDGSDPWFTHWEANCLVVEGNTAWIGQRVTHTTLPEIAPVGSEWTWQIQVDDQGILASLALRNDWLPGLELGEDCNDKGDFLAQYSQYWDNGSVQIR